MVVQAWGSQTYGDMTLAAWGSFDHYIAKIDASSGAGEWVLQTGGHGLEYVRRMATDANGDLHFSTAWKTYDVRANRRD